MNSNFQKLPTWELARRKSILSISGGRVRGRNPITVHDLTVLNPRPVSAGSVRLLRDEVARLSVATRVPAVQPGYPSKSSSPNSNMCWRRHYVDKRDVSTMVRGRD